MDIFTFEDNELMRLDSYQRVDETDSNEIEVRSQSGKKIIFVCGNCRRDKYDWAEINSIGSLSGITVRLAEEDREKTFMTGYGKAEAGKPEMCIIALRPLLSEIRLRSIRCDFSGKSYEGESIRNPKVYLINVNAQCSITDDGEILPTHIINTGGLMTDDLEKFHDPGIIYQEIDTDIGKEGLKNGISLFCYPNTSLTEGPGTPFTKLVIEGEIEGKTYWWPIEINRGEDISKPGIWRNSSYIYDIVIRRKGADSPDSSFEIGSMDLKMEAASWKEKEEYSVGF